MHAKINFEAMQTFGLAFSKKQKFMCDLFYKIENSLQKYHILMLNLSIKSYESFL